MTYQHVETTALGTYTVDDTEAYLHTVFYGTAAGYTLAFDDATMFSTRRLYRFTNMSSQSIAVTNFTGSITTTLYPRQILQATLSDLGAAAGDWLFDRHAVLDGITGGQTIIGGTGTTDDLILRATSGVGTTGSTVLIQTGNNGAIEAARFDHLGNVGFGVSAWGTNAVRVIGLASGTAPTTSPADMVQAWSADRGGTAGKAGLHIRSEDGTSFVFSDRVGLRTTAPTTAIHMLTGSAVSGATSVGTGITVEGSASAASTIDFLTDRTSATTFNFTDQDATAQGSITYGHDVDRLRFVSAGSVRFDTGGSTERLSIDNVGNLSLGIVTAGTSGRTVFAVKAGTAPTTSPADAFQIWSADRGAVAGKNGMHLRTEDGTSHVFADRIGFGTVAPTVFCELSAAGTAKSDVDFIAITNTVNAADMDATGTGILWNQWYYDAATPAVADAARILVATESDWTSVANTHDAAMAFMTAHAGTVTEHARFTAHGNLLIGDKACDATAAKNLVLFNATAPSAATANAIHIYSADTADTTASLAMYTEQAVEVIGATTLGDKLRVTINGTERFLLLGRV